MTSALPNSTRWATAPLRTHSWHGYLTLENFDAVAQRLTALLADGTFYTFVTLNDGMNMGVPEVRTSLRLTEEPRIHKPQLDSGKQDAWISFSDGNSLWSLHASTPTQADANAAVRAGDKRQTYLSFDGDRQVKIRMYSPSGHALCWVVTVEDHTDYS